MAKHYLENLEAENWDHAMDQVKEAMREAMREYRIFDKYRS